MRSSGERTTARSKVTLAAGVLVAALLATTLVAAVGAQPAQAAFPGANGKIAFISERDANEEIYTMNPDGSGQTRLTINAAEDRRPAVSPDGEKIAFESNRAAESDPNDFDIFVMDPDGTGGPTLLTTSTAGDFDPAFSPDGEKIAFVSFRDGNGEIYVMNANGTGQTNITNTPALDTQPVYSPDGARIAFVSFRDDNAEIYVMGSDGSNPTRLTTNLGTDENPSFSPDGESIAFVNRSDVYKMSSDGSNIKRLTRIAAGDFAPAFSPDGKKIVFVSSRNGDLEVFRMNARDGSRQKKLTNNAVVDTQPDWGVATP